MNPLFNKTSNDKDRIAKLELVVTRLARRSRKTALAVITPYPISNAISSEGLIGKSLEGVILRYMFSWPGKITKGHIRLDKKPKEGVEIYVRIFNDVISESKGFTVDKKTLSVDTNLEVKSGDCLEVTLTPIGESEVKEIWVSMLWVPNSGDVQNFLIEDLEKQIKEIAEEV
uniref:Uncharacterized protein n=1 Tax=viral metagenome TaxID=1070528 RepID=A0A6H1ZK80_9ZZZZ